MIQQGLEEENKRDIFKYTHNIYIISMMIKQFFEDGRQSQSIENERRPQHFERQKKTTIFSPHSF